jgi:hypothetical protein
MNMITVTKMMVAAALSAGALSVSGADVTSAKFESKYYKHSPLFSTAPSEAASSQLIGRFGPVGIGIELVQPAFAMKVANIEKGSPAEATGKLKPGQIIETINGRKLADIDPRIQLGNIITAAEASDGVVKFMVKESADAKAEEVVVKIPVLGAYSKTWPLNCPKSEKIVRGFADYLAKPDSNKGFAGIGMLFLLSTGEGKDLAPVKQWVHDFAGKPAPTYAWHLGFGGIPLCEYYLRTGDPVALPVIQSWVKSAAKGEYLDGWAGRGGVTGVDYGNGHLNAGGTAVVTFLMLAKECGAEVNDSLLQRTLRHFFRFAGRGNNPYGDDRPEAAFVDNGKNGNLAFAMAAAASLTPGGEKSVYAAARDICAMTGFYTTTYMLHGHTGGGIGELWRSSAMGLLHDKKPLQYREFMDHRQWHYELSRRFNGAFTILGGDDTPQGGCYDTEEWGAGYALTYTIPRKMLRITGAPLSKSAKQYALPARPWGTAADDVFLSLEAVPDADGKLQDLSGETLANDSAKPLIERLLAMGDVGDDVLRRHMHHPDSLIRNLAAKNAMGIKFNYMWVTPGDRTRPALIQEWLRSPDPRVRRAALGVLAQFLPAGKPEPCLTPEVFASVIAMLREPVESWWVKDAALNLVGRAPADWVAPHVDLLVPFLKHEEQWLQNAALIALTPVVADERCYQKVLPAIGELLRTCQRVSTINPVRFGPLPKSLAAASPEVQKLAAATLKGAFTGYAGVKTAAGGQDITTVYYSHLQFLASYLAGVKGGYDVLYEIAKSQFPSDLLPYPEIFLAADPEKFGPKLQQAIKEIIRDKLVYEFMGKNRAKLLAEIDRTTQSSVTMGILDDLTALYNKIGVHEYDWHAFGPDLKNAKWDYFTFDPPEKQAYDVSPWRYRAVTCPQGMENWFAPDFDPAKTGWKQGLPPFGQYKGKLATNAGPGVHTEPWPEPPRTLWANEVLLVRGTFQFPPLKSGHLYRLRAGTGQGVGAGDGFKFYLNGKPLVETKEGLGRYAGHLLRGGWITKDFAPEFAKGPVTIAAIAFLRYGDRAIVQVPPVPQGIFSLWLEEMKLPPINDESLRKSATIIPMLSVAWQEKQEPKNKELQTTADKFRYDGKFAANPKVLGNWTTVAVVPAIEVFDPAKPADANRAPFKAITFKEGGLTDSGALIWSGDTLMDLDGFQALKMMPKTIGGSEYLFIEAGGFSDKNPVGWKSPLLVLKKKP